VQPDPLPSPGAATTELDACTRALVLLEEEQNIKSPCEGCEQHATPYTLQILLYLPLLETAVHSIASSKGTTSIQHTAQPHSKVLRPPDLSVSPLEKLGGVLLRPVYAARKAGVEPIKGVPDEVHKLGGASLDTNTTSVPIKGIASIEPASGAVEATTARPKALEPTTAAITKGHRCAEDTTVRGPQ
jgi:hypothetical protein